jgi:hypothetical protein
MGQPWWVPAVQWTIWGIVMTVVMGWVAKSRLKTRSPSDLQQLIHPPSTLIIGVVVFLFFAGIAIVSNVFPKNGHLVDDNNIRGVRTSLHTDGG